MIENPPVSTRNEAPAMEAPHAVPLARLAGEEHDAERAALVRRLIDAEADTTRVAVSAFSSSI